jgi:hypothetical protein
MKTQDDTRMFDSYEVIGVPIASKDNSQRAVLYVKDDKGDSLCVKALASTGDMGKEMEIQNEVSFSLGLSKSRYTVGMLKYEPPHEDQRA